MSATLYLMTGEKFIYPIPHGDGVNSTIKKARKYINRQRGGHYLFSFFNEGEIEPTRKIEAGRVVFCMPYVDTNSKYRPGQTYTTPPRTITSPNGEDIEYTVRWTVLKASGPFVTFSEVNSDPRGHWPLANDKSFLITRVRSDDLTRYDEEVHEFNGYFPSSTLFE
jgi:hypothetical protein